MKVSAKWLGVVATLLMANGVVGFVEGRSLAQPTAIPPLLQVEGTLEPGDQTIEDDNSLYDVYPFEGQAGQTISIVMESQEFSPYLWLLDPQGQIIAQNDNFDEVTRNAQLFITLPQTGIYTVIANSYDSHHQGRYQLVVSLADLSLTGEDISRQRISNEEEVLLLADKAFQQLMNGQIESALTLSQQALELARQINFPVGEATAIFTVGRTNSVIGEYQTALELYEEALDMLREEGVRESFSPFSFETEASIIHETGLIFSNLGEYETAIDYYQDALMIHNEINAPLNRGATLLEIGKAYVSLGKHAEALNYYQQALEISIDQNYLEGESISLYNIGLNYSKIGEYYKALDILEKALDISIKIRDRAGEGDTLNVIGSIYNSLSQYPQAIEILTSALTIATETENHILEGSILNNLGTVYSNLGDYPQALSYHRQALAIGGEIGDLIIRGDSLIFIGTIQHQQGELQKALDSYGQVLELSTTAVSRPVKARVLNNIGSLYNSLGHYEKALENYQESLSISLEINDRSLQAITLGNLSGAYQRVGQYQTALEYAERSLEIYINLEDLDGQIDELYSIGSAHSFLGEYERAITFNQKALELAKQVGNRVHESNTLNGLGLIYSQLGEYQEAFEYYNESLHITQEIGNPINESTTLSNIGTLYHLLGQFEKSLEFYNKSLTLRRSIGDRSGEAFSLNNIGNTYTSMGSYEESFLYLEHALKIRQEIGENYGISQTLNNLGSIYLNRGEYEKALQHLQQSLSLSREMNNRFGEATILNNIGHVYAELNQYDEAIQNFEQALVVRIQINDIAGQARTLSSFGSVYLSYQKYADAEQAFLKALPLLETLKDRDLTDADKISLFETQLSTYKNLQTTLIAQNKTAIALEIAERGRARATVELLAEKISDRTAQDIITTAPKTTDIQRIAREQNATLVNYSIIDNAVGGPALYIWAIQPDGTIHFQSVDLNQLEHPLAELVKTSRQVLGVGTRSLARNDADIGIRLTPEAQQQQELEQQQTLQALHQLLIDPIAPHLPTDADEKVIFIPQGELFSVPFPALMDANDTYLIERHTILTAPSIQVLDLTRQQRQALSKPDTPLTANDVLIVGNPDMPSIWDPETEQSTKLADLQGALNEAFVIADLFNAEPLTWGDASETAVVNKMSDARVIHFATHGLLEYGIPEDSGVRDFPGSIALAPDTTADGFLTSGEIFDLNLKADLVVLSACDSGQGRITGDGVIGLSRAFITAGAPNLIVSLWAVDDDATADLMQEFYRLWQDPEQSLDKAQALRQAMLTTMKTHPDPRLWSAFTLIGDAQ